MKEEKKVINPKLKALNWLYVTLYKEEVMPRIIFKKFKEENTFFLDGMSIKIQRLEYDAHYLYLICRKMRLPITRSEIIAYLNHLNKEKN